MLFFLLSVVFWFLTKLSKEYESTIIYPIAYENLPDDKLPQEDLKSDIGVHVKATGFKILSGKLFPKTLKLDASNLFLKSNTQYYLLLSQQRLSIQRQMNTGVDIDHFINDSISLNLGSLSQKRVPVKLDDNLSFEMGYELNGPIQLQPDSITVSGPQSVIDTIGSISTNKLLLTDISESFQKELFLNPFPPGQNVRFNTNKVTAEGTVEKFTEGTLKVSFIIMNVPADVNITTLPKEVDITYKVALSNFNEIQASSFLVECDYNLSSENNLSYLVPKLVQHSDLVKNVKISPSKIDFFIAK